MTTYISYMFWFSFFFLLFYVIIVNGDLWFRGRGLKHFDQWQHQLCTQCYTIHKLVLCMWNGVEGRGKEENGVERGKGGRERRNK